jgi:predicted nucleic acid-binding protein
VTTHNVVVIDSSAVVAFLAGGDAGDWVVEEITGHRRAAPSLMPYEVLNNLRRQLSKGALDEDEAAAARKNLAALAIDNWPHSRLVERAWQLRGAVAYYDAAYVALAELLDAPLITLDRRLAGANGPMCEIRVPPGT